jgi:hypothetical protein
VKNNTKQHGQNSETKQNKNQGPRNETIKITGFEKQN